MGKDKDRLFKSKMLGIIEIVKWPCQTIVGKRETAALTDSLRAIVSPHVPLSAPACPSLSTQSTPVRPPHLGLTALSSRGPRLTGSHTPEAAKGLGQVVFSCHIFSCS